MPVRAWVPPSGGSVNVVGAVPRNGSIRNPPVNGGPHGHEIVSGPSAWVGLQVTSRRPSAVRFRFTWREPLAVPGETLHTGIPPYSMFANVRGADPLHRRGAMPCGPGAPLALTSAETVPLPKYEEAVSVASI